MISLSFSCQFYDLPHQSLISRRYESLSAFRDTVLSNNLMTSVTETLDDMRVLVEGQPGLCNERGFVLTLVVPGSKLFETAMC